MSSREELRSAAAAEVDRWEKQLNDELLRLFDRQQAVVLARLQGTKARKHTRHWEPPGDRSLEVKQVIDPARWVSDAAGSLMPIVRRLFAAVYKRVGGQLGGLVEPEDETAVEEAIQTRLELVGKGVENAVAEVEAFIDREEEAGTPMPQMVAGVRDLYAQRQPVWASRIATLSAVGSINQAGLFAAMDAGSSAKQWISRRDEKVRDTHVAADGQVRLLDERFRLGGIPTHPRKSLLMFPGDPAPSVPLDEVINCRCTLVFSPPRSKKSAPDDVEVKVDYVRTPAGSRHYGQPIGTPIRPDLAPSFSAPGAGSPAAAASPAGYRSRLGSDGKPRLLPGDRPAPSDAELAKQAGPRGVSSTLIHTYQPRVGGQPSLQSVEVYEREDGAVAEFVPFVDKDGYDDSRQVTPWVYPAGKGPQAAPAAPARAVRLGKIGGIPAELAGDDPKVRAVVAKYSTPGAVPDPAKTEVLALRDRKSGRVGGYVVWQTEDGDQPKGTILAVSVHPSLRGHRVGDQMVQMVAAHDASVKPTSRPATSAPVAPASRTVANAPTTTKPRGPVLDANGLPVVPDRRRPGDQPGTSGDFDADAARIDRLQKAYVRDRMDTTSLFSRGGRWSRDREKQQQAIIDHFLNQPGVKKDKQILILGGLPGSGKTTTINSPAGQQALGINLDDYVTVNADEVKEQMIARGMVPDYPGLAPDEAATLFHAESFEVAHSLMRQAAKQGKNFAYDTSLKTSSQAGFATGAAGRVAPPPWKTTVLFVDVPVSVAKQRARQRYLDGGRYMPLGLIDGMRSSSRRYSSGPSQQFDAVKGRADRWVVVDNAGVDPVVVGQGGKGSRRSSVAASPPPPPRPPARPVAPSPDPSEPRRVSEGRMTAPQSERDLSVGQRVWVRSSGDGSTWEIEPGTVESTDVYAGDPDADPQDPAQVGLRLDSGASLETEYWHVVTKVDGDEPPAAAAPAAPAPRKRAAAAATSAPAPAPAPAAAPAAPAGPQPGSGLPAALPPVPAGARVYAHPQGKHIYVLPDGSMQTYKPDGKRATSSATPQKLAAGYGGWSEVSGSSAPEFGPTTKPAASPSTGTSPKLVADPATAPTEQPGAPAPAGSMPVAPMDFNEASLADVPKYIADPDYVFQQKVDGIRGVLVVEPGKQPWFASKKGDRLQSSTAAKITGPILAKMPGTPAGSPSYRVEGELLNGKFHVFDMVVVGQESTPYEDRKTMADTWAETVGATLPQVEPLPTARTAAEKQALWDKVVASGAEGVMMKRRDAGYQGGARVNHTLKAKVTATADVVVVQKGLGGKDNAQIALLVNGKVTPIGTVSTLGKGQIDPGDVVEVEYLWATEGNSLAQPRIKRKRPDKTVVDVTDASQLRVVDKTVLELAAKHLHMRLEHHYEEVEHASGS